MGVVVFFLVTSPFLVLFTFLLVIKLTHTIPMLWDIVFIPVWLLFIGWFVYIIYIIWKRRKMLEHNKSSQPRFGISWKDNIVFQIISMIIVLTFAIMLCVLLKKNDSNRLDGPFVIGTFIPFWIYSIYIVLYGLGCGIGTKRCIYCQCTPGNPLLWFYIGLWISIETFSILLVINIVSGRIGWHLIFIPVWFAMFMWFSYILYLFYVKMNRTTTDETIIKNVDLLFQAVCFAASLYFMVLLNIELQTPNSVGIISTFLPVIILLISVFVLAYCLDYRNRPETSGYNMLGKHFVNIEQYANFD